MDNNKDGKGAALIIGGGVGAIIATLLSRKPAEAASPEAKWDYLIELIQQILTAIGAAPPGIDVTVKTPWVAKDPEQIYDNAIRSIGTFLSDIMVNFTEGKRLLFVVQSSLNQACNIQLIGNYVDDTNRAVNINGVLPCPANTSISIGLAWDDWHPFIGVRITTAVAPTAGILNIWAVIQE